MSLSRKWRLLVSLVAFGCIVPHLSAVIAEGRMYHGVKVTCLHGGVWLFQDLGVYSRARVYEEQVFTGTVLSAVQISFTDKRLQIVPDEVFLGDVSGETTATVNQACLWGNPPEIKAGDKWLFFLRTSYLEAKPYKVVDFDSPAKPVSLADYDICLLRLHTDIDESCIALMPARPRDTRGICRLKLRPSSFMSHSPNPFREFQENEIRLVHISPPPEFRTNHGNGLNATSIFKTPDWIFSCPPDDD